MPNFHLASKRLYKSRAVRFNEQFNWPPTTLENIIGIPDILNEKLADSIVQQTQKKVKENELNKERNRLRISNGDLKIHRSSLVSRTYLKVLRKAV